MKCRRKQRVNNTNFSSYIRPKITLDRKSAKFSKEIFGSLEKFSRFLAPTAGFYPFKN